MKRGYKYNTLQQPVKIFESGARHPAASPAQWKEEEKNKRKTKQEQPKAHQHVAPEFPNGFAWVT
jgi:hypothetical protein